MNDTFMVRYGADAEKMRPMKKDDILISRLNLLIIMAKAHLKSYPTGEFRRKAITENARFVFHEASNRSRSGGVPAFITETSQLPQADIKDRNHLFYQRAQLLAVMVNAFTEKKAGGGFRNKALVENIGQLCDYLANGFQLGDTQILQVA